MFENCQRENKIMLRKKLPSHGQLMEDTISCIITFSEPYMNNSGGTYPLDKTLTVQRIHLKLHKPISQSNHLHDLTNYFVPSQSHSAAKQ